jgi:tetratricopeptide (TPR) repeat protein
MEDQLQEAILSHVAGVAMVDAGRHAEAVPFFEQALAACRSTLGEHHPGTMTVAGNLAVTYFSVGQQRKGLKAITRNLADRARVLGDEHPDTLAARSALATAYRVNGDADTAIALAEQLLSQCARTFGPASTAQELQQCHPDGIRAVLSARMVLALALAAGGDVAVAHELIASTMTDAEAALGGDHPHTLALLDCGVAHGLLREE